MVDSRYEHGSGLQSPLVSEEMGALCVADDLKVNLSKFGAAFSYGNRKREVAQSVHEIESASAKSCPALYICCSSLCQYV